MKTLFIFALLSLCLFSSCDKATENQIKIAIITPVSHPSLEETERGFLETLDKKSPGRYSHVTYNAQGSKTLMRSEIEEIARKEYDLVFTIGTTSSQMAKEVFSKKGIDIPIVFSSVNDPVGIHLVSSEEHPGGNITGVKELLEFENEIAHLLSYKPQIARILLVYNPLQPGLQQDQELIKQILNEKNIALTTVEIFQASELLAKTTSAISQADAVLILKDNTVVSGLEVLVKLCERHKIPLMASDLDSSARGAAFGFGVHEIEFGIEAAKKALEILEGKKNAGSIPVTPVTGFTLRINEDAAKKQGVNLP